MPFDCPRCGKTIEFSGERPSFCPYCGVALSSITQIHHVNDATFDFMPGDDDATEAYVGATPGTDGVPAAIGGYRLVRLLGAGGMGAVYEGISEDSGQRVAVKLLHAPAKSTSGTLDRFRQEGQLASQLSHPHCVFVLRADEEAGKPYIVMELMPGETLRDAVRQHGPLSADEAVAKILDVIDGLIEAHRFNILHRDVKPSNCFVMADGRVKVGDFGLSKSLATDVNLTQTGSFLGTVLYAAEQIRGEPLDYSADVYSVCATLYFLLTGRAPFQHENPTVVISRVISETPPDIAMQRPDLPGRLQKVVMRGLDREPSKRFQSLEELRTALAEMVSRPLERGSLGARAAAYLIDLCLLMPIWLSLTVVEAWLRGSDTPIWIIPKFLYFAICEYAYGATFGKWVLRFRVVDGSSGGPPRPWQLVVRTAIFVGLTFGAGMVAEAFLERLGASAGEAGLVAYVGGWLLIFSTMRRRNGYRGLHEIWSNTPVVQLPWPRPVRRIVSPMISGPAIESITDGLGLSAQFGSYRPTGILERGKDSYCLCAADEVLRRDVHLHVRREPAEVTSEERKTLVRPARTRWLGGGATDGWLWDAYLAPAGAPLPEIVKPGRTLGWPETLAILEQVTEELHAAATDETLTGPMTARHVYVRADNRVTLLNPLGDRALSGTDSLALLREVATVALEGRPRLSNAHPTRIKAVVPLHAAKVLNRLIGIDDPLHDVPTVRTALRKLETRPAETATPQRIVSLAFLGFALAAPLAFFLLFSALFNFMIVLQIESGARLFKDIVDTIDHHPATVVPHVPRMADPAMAAWVRARYEEKRSQNEADAVHIRAGLNAAERIVRRIHSWHQPSNLNGEPDYEKAKIDLIRSTSDGQWKLGEESSTPGRDFAFALAFGFNILAWMFVIGTIIWSAATRGGWSLAFAGLGLVRNDGRRAARWQCILRTLIIFVIPLALLCGCVVVKATIPHWMFLHNLLWWSALLWLVGFAVIGVMYPGRGPQDRLTGLYVVPR